MRKLFVSFFLLLITNISFANFPYFPVTFPRDGGAHFNNIPYDFSKLMEWWYFNGYLKTDEGKELSYDVAFFNPAVKFGRLVRRPTLHIQIADLQEKISLGTSKTYFINSGKVSTEKMDISLDKDYLLQEIQQNGKTVYLLRAEGNENNHHLKVDLTLEPLDQPFLIAGNGLMDMPNNTNSYYYSIPHFKTTGTIQVDEKIHHINNAPGDSWFDHQWGDFDVLKNGWEWFSVRLNNGIVANIFLNIEYSNHNVLMGLASIILPDGKQYFIPSHDFIVNRYYYWTDPQTGIHYPMSFDFKFPQLDLEMISDAAFPEQQRNGYWEGYCHAKGIYKNQAAAGFAYMELVYAPPEKYMRPN